MKTQNLDHRKIAALAEVMQNASAKIAAILGEEAHLRLLNEPPPKRPVNDTVVADIIAHTAELFNVSVADMKSASRERPLPDARGVAMIAIRNKTSLAFKTIGLHFGGRDHSTVITRINVTIKLADTEKDLSDKISAVLGRPDVDDYFFINE